MITCLHIVLCQCYNLFFLVLFLVMVWCVTLCSSFRHMYLNTIFRRKQGENAILNVHVCMKLGYDP